MLTHDMPNMVENYYAAQVKGQPRIQIVCVILLCKLNL